MESEEDKSENSISLKIGLVVALAVLIGEIIYFTPKFLSLKFPKFPSFSIADLLFPFPTPPSLPPPPPLQFVTPTTKIPSPVLTTPMSDIFRGAQNFSETDLGALLKSNYFLQRKVVNKMYLTSEYQGKIVSFKIDKNITLPKDYKLEYYLNLQKDIDGKTIFFDFTFDKQLLNNTKILDVDKKTISYINLKIGQNIKINTVYDFQNKVYTSFEITVTN